MKNSVFFILIVFSLVFQTSGYAGNGDEGLFKEGIPPLMQKQKRVFKRQNFSKLVKIAEKAVVNISGELVKKEKENGKEEFDGGKIVSLGSGFIISKEGFILTNNHVIESAKNIKVRFDGDMKQYSAKILGKDPQVDIALLKIIEARNDFNFLYLGDSDKLHVGEWVIAIGNQFQLGQTVTAGIVSAVSRQVQGNQAFPFANYIQTDASINPGSSGGPLLNTRGQVVGINTAIFSPSRFGGAGFNIGIGFSTPMNQVKKIINQLKEQGKVDRGALGIIIQQVDEEVREALNLEKISGALVADVLKNSVAEKIGIKIGDVVTNFNDFQIKDFSELSLRVSEMPLGSKAKIGLIRNGKFLTLNATINKFDAKDDEKKKKEKDEDYIMGLLLKDMNKKLADVLQLEDFEGVLITDIKDDEAFLDSGIQRGDLIKEVAGKKITNVIDVKNAIKSKSLNKPFLILLKRGEHTRYLIYKLLPKQEKEKVQIGSKSKIKGNIRDKNSKKSNKK